MRKTVKQRWIWARLDKEHPGWMGEEPCSACAVETDGVRQAARRVLYKGQEYACVCVYERHAARYERYMPPALEETFPFERRWCADLLDMTTDKGIVLTGEIGCGKTTYALQMAAELRQSFGIVAFMRWTQLVDALDGLDDWTLAERRVQASETVSDLLAVPYLIVDGMAQPSARRTFGMRFEDFLERQAGVLIITTHYTPSELVEFHGRRVLSLISGRCEWFRMSGGDKRI